MYTIFLHLPVCIPEITIIDILVTFTYHLYNRTVKYQPQTKIFEMNQFYTKLFYHHFSYFAVVRHFLDDISKNMVNNTKSILY